MQPPLPSRATRSIAKRSRHSSRGAVVADLPSQERPRVIQFESKLEQRVLHLYLARPDIWDVWEQPPSVTYRDERGAIRQHVLDFLVTLRCGRRLAIAVKPLERVRRSGFLSELRALRKQLSKDVADDLILVTDQDFTKEEALDAERYLSIRRGCGPDDLSEVAEAFRAPPPPKTLRELVERLGGGSTAFQSIYVAIYADLLNVDRTRLIDLDTSVRVEGRG